MHGLLYRAGWWGMAEKKLNRNLRASQLGAEYLPVASIKDIVGSPGPDRLVRGEALHA